MYLQVKIIEKVAWNYKKGYNLRISRVWLYDSRWRFTRRVELNDVVLDILKNVKIEITDDWQLAQYPVLFQNNT